MHHPVSGEEVQTVQVVIEQHYWAVTSKKVFQTIADGDCYGTTKADIEQKLGLTSGEARITDENQDKTDGQSKPDRRSLRQI